MLIARASERQRQIALRAALGAGRGRVIRQLLTEGMVLFIMGGTLGLALAAAGVRAIVRLAPPTLTQIRDVEVNWTVALYAIGLAPSAASCSAPGRPFRRRGATRPTPYAQVRRAPLAGEEPRGSERACLPLKWRWLSCSSPARRSLSGASPGCRV
jgi:hypothetical protein